MTYESIKHEWTLVVFSYGLWIECTCGFIPESQEEMDEHIEPDGTADAVRALRTAGVHVLPFWYGEYSTEARLRSSE